MIQHRHARGKRSERLDVADPLIALAIECKGARNERVDR